jgi:alginate O-acetyltransferase complex protein AlgI
MLFNTVSFAIFLPIVFILYWFCLNKRLKFQNLLLLASSYFFYACWDWRFLFLLVFSTFLDYFTGIRMYESKAKNRRAFWFWLSLSVNIGFLSVFKYYNFFAASFGQLISNFGLHLNPWTLSVILPVGISFYTFHGLSYVIDIYKNRIRPERNFVDYSVFVSFFPLLVAGPIERATHLLPQIKKKRAFDYCKAVDGLRQILWGLFKKVVIADTSAGFANQIFNNYTAYNGSTLILGSLFFAFQIYGDFSGYSDIAIGTAKLFGIDLLRNFAYPYFSRDIAEFWRRWHISLSTWFRDYLYIPLGGSKGGTSSKVRNTFVIFIVSGFWHGANWTFIVWGLLNALYIMPSIIRKKNRNNLNIVAPGRLLPTIKELFSIIITFSLTTLAWIFFRSGSLTDALAYTYKVLSKSSLSLPEGKAFINSSANIYQMSVIIPFFMIVEWLGRHYQHPLENFGLSSPIALRWAAYIVLIGSIYFFNGKEQQFIYFQF